MTNIQENCMKVNVKLNFLFITQVQAFAWRKLFRFQNKHPQSQFQSFHPYNDLSTQAYPL